MVPEPPKSGDRPFVPKSAQLEKPQKVPGSTGEEVPGPRRPFGVVSGGSRPDMTGSGLDQAVHGGRHSTASPELQTAARFTIEDYLQLGPTDRLLVIGQTDEVCTPSYAIYLEATAKFGKGTKHIDLGSYRGEGPEVMKQKIIKEINDFCPTASVFAATCEKGEQEAVSGIVTHLTRSLSARHVHMPGMTVQDMEKFMTTSPTNIENLALGSLQKLICSSKVTITDDLGTDLTFEFNPKPNTWQLSLPKISFLPAAEAGAKPASEAETKMDYLPSGIVWAKPLSVSGTLFVRLLGEPLVGKQMILNKADGLQLEIAGSRIDLDSVKSNNPKTTDNFKAYLTKLLSRGTAGDLEVASLGVGTNPDLPLFLDSFVCNRAALWGISFGEVEMLLHKPKVRITQQPPG
ncbi:Uncharacterised protein [Candidatus Burarchaeum australiense]|nr:Uncharacterised protein [Candidatus Burarchaeum australiense]